MNEQLFAGFPRMIFLLILGGVTLLFGYLLKPFFFAIFWAVILAAIFSPFYRWVHRRLKSPSLCALLALGAVFVTLVIPVGLLVTLLVGESFDLYQALNTRGADWMTKATGLFNTLGSHPLAISFGLDQEFLTGKSVEVLKGVADFLFKNLSALTQNTLVFLVQLAVMFYCLFYFLRDGHEWLEVIKRYLPVDKRHLDTFVSEFLVTAKATLKVTFVIGGVQGVLGGLIFFIAGIESALVWGVLMLALSIMPAVGCAIIWAPAGIVMLVSGNIWQGVTILVFGAVVISSADNFLRPILLSGDIQMHSLLIFLSTLGGIVVFGFSGFVLGPVLASFFLAAWKLFLELHSEAAHAQSPES